MAEIITLALKMQKSPFSNIYWFARALVNTDLYGAIGRRQEKKLLQAVNLIEAILRTESLPEEKKFLVAKEKLRSEILQLSKAGTKAYFQDIDFVEMLNKEIKTVNDLIVFCITVKYVVLPINQAMTIIPSDDNQFCKEAVKAILDKYGETEVGTAIVVWDELGVKGCLEAERATVVEYFTSLLDNLNKLNIEHTAIDDNIIMTAFVQEFERRLGQKRKNRGGHSLESVTSFLFEYFNLPSSERPAHFDQNIEVDKWFKCKDGWTIGISCKRTLRERWKQTSGAKNSDLSHFKIKELWHLTTYDKDLSDDKIVNLGKERQIFYLQDDSPVYERAKKHAGMKLYVRPLSKLISDIRENLYGSSTHYIFSKNENEKNILKAAEDDLTKKE